MRALDVGAAVLSVRLERDFPFRTTGHVVLATSLCVRAGGLELAFPTAGPVHVLEADGDEAQTARARLGGAWRPFARVPRAAAMRRAGPFVSLAHGAHVYFVGVRDATSVRLDVPVRLPSKVPPHYPVTVA